MRIPFFSVTAAMLLLAAPLAAQGGEAAVPAPGLPVAGERGAGPNGATMRCRDGSYPAPGAPDSACDGKGGILVRFPVRRAPQLPAGTTQQRAIAAPVRAVPDSTVPEGFVPWRQRQQRVAEEEARLRMPEGATLRCEDGTWVVRDTVSARCATHGGVALRIAPLRPEPPARPRQP